MNRHFIPFALAFAAALSGVAKTFDVDISTGRPAASNEAYYHGETIEFRAVRGRSVVTNVEYSCVYYQTNGMDSVWWHTDGLVFHPTNDVGAASYRFFLEGRDDLGRDWHANGLLRLLPSPGFTPNEIELPVARLDFANIEVANPPYYDKAETEAKIVELAPAPGDYAAVSNAAMNVYTQYKDYDETAYYYPSEICSFQGRLYRCWGEPYVTGAFNPQDWEPVDVIGDLIDGAGLLQVGSAIASDMAWTLLDEEGSQWGFEDIYDPTTNALEIARAATATNALQDAELESHASQLSQLSQSLDGKVPTSRTINGKALTSNISLSASEVGAATAEDVYRIVAGTNVLLIVTNYNSAVHAPLMSLQHLDPETGEYVTYWDEARGHGITLTNAMDYADGVAARLDAEKAPRAWSRVTSGLGADAPEGTTFISTPVTHISGGFEFEKKITAGGTVWTLCSTSLAAGSTTNGFFEISALDGTPVFSVEKTDSVLVGVNASAIAVVDNACVISVPAVADTHPFARVATTLVQPTWYKETEDGMPAQSPATVSWSGQSGAWVATVDFGATPQGFVFFEYLQEGGVKIVNSAVVDLSQGVHYGGATYMPTVSGNELKFIRQ